MSQIKIKRGTRTQLDAAAGLSGLIQGEPYLITDEGRLAVGLSATTYADCALLGEIVPSFSATNSNAGAITIGQPVYVDGSGTVDLAKADAAATDRVIGLVADASIASSGSGGIQTSGVLTSADWTSVIGSTNLIAGEDYFLSDAAAGQLVPSTSVPTTGFIVYVGHALTTTTMLISIDRPVGL